VPLDERGRIDARLNEIARTLAASFAARGGRAVIGPNGSG